MKARYKVLSVVILLWIGMSYEGSRDAIPASTNIENATLDEQIRLYELGLVDENPEIEAGDLGYTKGVPHSAYQGNWFARTGRRIGNALQSVVRETLRSVVKFFDGIIT